jgi:hypothetical protein
MADDNGDFPFNPDNDLGFPSYRIAAGILFGDSIAIASNRMKPCVVQFTRDAEFDPVRDAIVLEALLETSLPSDTFRQLIVIIFRKFGHLMKALSAGQDLDLAEPPDSEL